MAINQASRSAVTNVPASATAVTLLAANSGAIARTIMNDSTSATLYVKLGTGASATNYTVALVAGAYYELPQPVYTGAVTGIWATATGFANVTEES